MADHTLLNPEATTADVAALVAEGAELGVYSVCVSPSMIPPSVPNGLLVATVCGCPSGKHTSAVKAAEAAESISNGADEVDMVIIESAALTDDAIVGACKAAVAAGADFVKTSTGFHPAGGASVHAVELMRKTVGPDMGIKASGGIRTAEAALALVNAGATRLGLSSTRAVLDGLDGVVAPEDDSF